MNFKKIFPILVVGLLLFSCNGNNSHIDIDDEGNERISGYATYTDGTPISGMVVSDGFSCVITDKEGYYSIESPSSNTFYIYASIPADCKIKENPQGNPDFYHKYSVERSIYDFQIERIEVENDFVPYALADPQCANEEHISNFELKTVADIKEKQKSDSLPPYGVTLGDIVYSKGERNCVPLMKEMRRIMSKSNIGFPIFQTMGNHDVFVSATQPIEDVDFNLGYQRDFEEVFGPINYSWNRGSVHFIHMRNIIYKNKSNFNSYDNGFTIRQVKWLKQDLMHVPKDKLVVLCVHLPLLRNNGTNLNLVRLVLSSFENVIVFSGHLHYMRNGLNLPLPELVHPAVCGALWSSFLNGDGLLNSYGIHHFSGNKIVNSIFKGAKSGAE
jgi:hypothetical protein